MLLILRCTEAETTQQMRFDVCVSLTEEIEEILIFFAWTSPDFRSFLPHQLCYFGRRPKAVTWTSSWLQSKLFFFSEAACVCSACSYFPLTKQIIGHLLIISIPHLLLLLVFISFFSNVQKPTCVCVCVCLSVPAMRVNVIQGVLVGVEGRAGRAGLAVFVPAGINAARKPGNEVRRRSFHLSSSLLPSSPASLPLHLSLCILLALASVTAASSVGSVMLLSASLVWAIAAVGSISYLCAVWTKR